MLFSVDLEDAPASVGQGKSLPVLVESILALLRRHDGRGTFFVVGAVARREPALVRAIMSEGHEIGCHSDAHVPLTKLGPSAARDDTLRALEALAAAGAPAVRGYRAPCFSLVHRTDWMHAILADLGFAYSSSVLPAPNPLFGWPGFGRRPRRMVGGLWEIPVSLLPARLPPLPLGGVYLRALPRWLVSHGLRRASATGRPVVSYVHPYDCDPAGGGAGGGPFGLLLRRNRGAMLDRFEQAAATGFRFAALAPYLATLSQAEEGQ